MDVSEEKAAWIAEVRILWSAVEEHISAHGDLLSAASRERDLIFAAWALLMRKIPEIRSVFESIDEDPLSEWAEDFLALMLEGATPELPPNLLFDEAVLQVAALLRALETNHLDHNVMPFPASEGEVACSYGGDEGFFVPLAPVLAARSRQSPNAKALFRRALSRSRIYPKKLDTGQRVRLGFVSPTMTPDSGAPLALGAAIFENYCPTIVEETVESTRGFYVSEWSCECRGGQVEIAIDSSTKGDFEALVFPELTMPPSAVAELVRIYSRRKGRAGNEIDMPPLVTVAGSWHETRSGVRRNTSIVLSATGRQIGTYTKLFAYSDRDLGEELVERGSGILIIIGHRAVFSVAICLDFIADRPENPFPYLDVDLVLVPSCGGIETILQHAAHATKRTQSGVGRSFVVQQTIEKNHHYGFVLPANLPGKEAQTELEGARVAEGFTARQFMLTK